STRRPEARLRPAPRRLIPGHHLTPASPPSHPAPTAARRRLQDQRKPDPLGLGCKLLLSLNDALASGNRWQSGRLHFPPRTVLFSHHLDHLWLRANEGDLRRFAHLGEIRRFRHEA